MQELDERSRLIQDRRAVHFPDGDVAAGVTPQNVAPAVAVEITCPDDRPGAGHIRHERGRCIQDTRAVHLPNRNVAGSVVPGDVVLAVTWLDGRGNLERERIGVQVAGPLQPVAPIEEPMLFWLKAGVS
jgi:hypothetical protein